MDENKEPLVIPHSREAEEAAIGSVFINPLVFFSLLEIIKPSDFYIHRNRWIWESFKRLHESREPIDLLTVSEDLNKHGSLNEVGGSAYLTSLVAQVPVSTNAEAYARVIEGHSQNRKLIEYANEIASLAYSGKPIEKKLSIAKSALEGIEKHISVEDEFQPLNELFSEVYDEAERRSKDPKEVWGIPTGFNKLDKETGGQQGGELTFWVGEPGVGKTWTLIGMALEMSKYCSGGFLSMELKKQNVARRVLSGTSGVPTRALRSGFNIDWLKVNKAVEDYADFPLFLMYRSVTSEQLYHIVRQAKKKYNFGFLVIDYAMLFVDSAKDDNERTALVSRNLKSIATTFDISVNCIHSVTKMGMDNVEGNPAKSFMRGSGQQIHDADNVYFLTKYKQTDTLDGFLREEQTKRMVTLWCQKGRELENSDFNIHLVRKGQSPFFAEYDRVAAMQERGF